MHWLEDGFELREHTRTDEDVVSSIREIYMHRPIVAHSASLFEGGMKGGTSTIGASGHMDSRS